MKRKTSAAMVCLLIAASFTCTQAQQIIDGFQAPESVLKNGDKIFVSNIGGAQPNPGAKDGDGYISELSSDGKIIQQKFQKSTLNGPKGLAVMNNVLYASDIDRVVGFDINSGEQIFELNIPGAAFLNDLCKAEDNMLAVSESMSGKIYLINTSNKSFKFFGSIPGANGVTYDANTKQLYACGMGAQMNGTGKLYVKDINSKDTLFTELQNSPTGVFDGLESRNAGHRLQTIPCGKPPVGLIAVVRIFDEKHPGIVPMIEYSHFIAGIIAFGHEIDRAAADNRLEVHCVAADV